jgi:vesicle-fusing ATPase
MVLDRWSITETMCSYGVAPCPSDPLALTNRLVVNPNDFAPDVEFVILRDHFILSIM